MTRILIPSDRLDEQSDESQGFFSTGPARTPSSHRARDSADRTGHARDPERDLQALRPSQLPLRRRPRPWAQALSLRQPIRRTAPQRLCAQRRYGSRRTVDQQSAPASPSSRRDLRDQYRAFAAPRGSWVERHEPRECSVRLDRGGSHYRRHGVGLSRCCAAALSAGDAR